MISASAKKQRDQDARKAAIFDAAMQLSKKLKSFTAAQLFGHLYGTYPKTNMNAGNPTNTLTRALTTMVSNGDLIVTKRRGRPASYSSPQGGRTEAAPVGRVAPKPRPPAGPGVVMPPSSFIRPLTPQELTQGRARPARARRVYLEEPLWPEERAR